MSAGRNWLLWGPFLLAGVLLIVWYLVWRTGADAMRVGLADFAANEAAAGGAVSYAPMRARGFPFFLRGEVRGFSLARGKYGLDAETVYLHASPIDLRRIVFSTDPSLRLSTPSGVWSIRAQEARASIEKTRGGWLFKAQAAKLDGVNGETAAATGRVVINVSPDETDNYRISFRVLDANLRNLRGQAAIARLDAAMTAKGDPLAVAIHRLDAEVSAARLGLSGMLSRDGEGFLAGRLDASIDNPPALMEALIVLGAVKPERARNVEAGLTFLAAAGGGRISAPLHLESGEIKIAGLKFAPAPRLGQP